MKISIDFDGTMWSHMDFFREFMRAMQGAGHQVGCLTAHTEDSREGDLALMRARGFPEPDFWFGRDGHQPNAAYHKSAVMLREGIDIHFDDCDYGNPETVQMFRELLGEQAYRLVRVEGRLPGNVHYA